VILAERAVRIGAGRVEVAQRDRPQAVGPLEVRQRPLDRELRLAVGVDRALRMRFGDRRLDRIAERGRGGREDEVLDPGLRGRAQHREGAADVVLVITGGIADRIADRQPGGEVHDRVHAVRADDLGEPRGVGDGAVLERRARRLRGAAVPRAQVVVDDNVGARRPQRLHGMAADVTGPARDEDAHRRPIE
jgi:hypothetical protein